ncbi:MAG: hypothetical protein MMC33_003030 [Icmadophila ericetorum]|nr:hypothetical protein [Icmadophila ericetorum]
MAAIQEPGGFLLTLPTPPASTISSPGPHLAPTLPVPRNQPLKSGSSKESSFIAYVDRKLLDISRDYEKRFDGGYEGFGACAKDLEGVVDVVWVSGTPSLQTPYLLTIALAVTNYMPAFNFAPRETFSLLGKMDVALSSLLQGRNAETGNALPGFEGGRGRMSVTDKVRMRGIVSDTRLAVVNVAGKGMDSVRGESRIETETEDEEDFNMESNAEINYEEDRSGPGSWEMEVARVYERTIVELGSTLDSSGY